MTTSEYLSRVIDLAEAIESSIPRSFEHMRLLEQVHELSTRYIWAQANLPEDIGREVTPTVVVPGGVVEDLDLPPGAIIVAVPMPDPAEA
jgi:hypothetical protein